MYPVYTTYPASLLWKVLIGSRIETLLLQECFTEARDPKCHWPMIVKQRPEATPEIFSLVHAH